MGLNSQDCSSLQDGDVEGKRQEGGTHLSLQAVSHLVEEEEEAAAAAAA